LEAKEKDIEEIVTGSELEDDSDMDVDDKDEGKNKEVITKGLLSYYATSKRREAKDIGDKPIRDNSKSKTVAEVVLKTRKDRSKPRQSERNKNKR
jgi:hypothetical protein